MHPTNALARSRDGNAVSMPEVLRLLILRIQSLAASILDLRSSLFNLSPSTRRPRSFARSGWRRRLVCLALMLNLLIWPGPNLIARQLPVFAATSVEYTSRTVHSIAGFFRLLFHGPKKAAAQESLADRIARVSKIRITPPKFVGYLGDKVSFSGLPQTPGFMFFYPVLMPSDKLRDAVHTPDPDMCIQCDHRRASQSSWATGSVGLSY